MDTLATLHAIEKMATIYEIVYRNAGVGITFYEGERMSGHEAYQDTWRRHLVVHAYYPTFEAAVDAEYARLGRGEEPPMSDPTRDILPLLLKAGYAYQDAARDVEIARRNANELGQAYRAADTALREALERLTEAEGRLLEAARR